MHKEAFEPTGLIPRSIIRTFDRFRQQLLPGTEQIAIQEYRISRYQILVSIKTLCTLIFVPFLVSYTVKFFLITPITEHFWEYQQGDIFLNSYQEKRAFNEMHDFSEKIFFESLINSSEEEVWTNQTQKTRRTNLPLVTSSQTLTRGNLELELEPELGLGTSDSVALPSKLSETQPEPGTLNGPDSKLIRVSTWDRTESEFSKMKKTMVGKDQPLFPRLEDLTKGEIRGLPYQEQVNTLNLQIRFQKKSLEIAERYNKQSILAITSLLGDFVTLLTLYLLFALPQMKPQIIILKSFLTESLYSLSDTTKSFLLILGMDLLVGFHSPRGWEIFLESVLRHFGLPENESFILLFVALFPVFLDTVFKYWIFRYLNKISPSTVVTYHSMLE